MRKRKGKPISPASPNHCRAVLVIDGTATRQKARKAYQKVLRDLDLARQELGRFQDEDKPRFQQWMNREFGALLTQLRETSQQRAAKEQLVLEIESEVFFSGVSHGQAYLRVQRRRETPAADNESAGDERGSSGRPPHGDESKSAKEPGEPWEADLNDLFEEMEDAFEDLFGEGPKRRSARNGDCRPKPVVGRVKELYRALVRRLHPDTQTEMTGQKLEWWHQVQEAYQKGDAEQLEVILSLCEIEERGTTAQTSVSLLARITRELASSLRSLKRQLTQCRYDPAWNFSKRADLERLSAQTQRALESELFDLQRSLERLEMQLNRWASEAERARTRKPRRKRQPTYFEFPF